MTKQRELKKPVEPKHEQTIKSLKDDIETQNRLNDTEITKLTEEITDEKRTR